MPARAVHGRNAIRSKEWAARAPGPDFVLIVQVADMPAYHALAHRLFAAHTNVRNVKAYFSTFRSKFETRIAV